MATGVPMSFSNRNLQEEVDGALKWTRPESAGPKFRLLLSRIGPHAITVCITALICWLFWARPSVDISSTQPATKILTCGNSTEEARALGCEFDQLTVAWIPKPCFDLETSQEFMADSPWRAYTDKTSNEVIDRDQMAEYVAPGYYYTSAREHAVHCLFAMQKLHKAYQRHGSGLYLDSESSNLMHTRHCISVVKNAIDRDSSTLQRLETRNTVALTKCEVDA